MCLDLHQKVRLYFFVFTFLAFSALETRAQGQVKDSPLKDSLEPPSVEFEMPTSTPPGAVLPADKMVDVGTEVIIDGSSSTGTSLTYRWNFDVFPIQSNAKIDNPTASMIRFTPDVEGLYLVKLVVRDANNNSTPSYLAIRAVSSNTPPSFNLSYRTLSSGFPKLVRLRVRSRSDDGEIRLVEVDYGDGHQVIYQGREADSIGYNIDHYYQTSGSYTAKVALIDDKGARTEESLVIDLSQDNQVPVLKYSVNSTSGTAPFTLRVDASTSFDPDNNTPLHFYWEWGHESDYAYTEDFISTYTYTEPGIYTVFALADDRAGGRVYNEFTVYVDDPDNPGTYSAPSGGSPPVLDIMATSPRVGTSPLTVNFDASRSFDLEGDNFEVFWYFYNFAVDKRHKEGLRVSQTFKAAGTYEFRVGIRDSHGNELIGYYEVLIYDTTADEEPRFFIEQRGPREFTMFIGNPLYDVSVTERNYFWDFGDNTYGRFNYQRHTYSSPGIYPVTLTVLDTLGNRRTVSKVLNVTGTEDDVKLDAIPFYQKVDVGNRFSLSGVHPDTGDPSLLDIFWGLETDFKESSSTITHSYPERGIYRTWVYGTNDNGVVAEAGARVIANSGLSPKASSKLSTYVGVAPLTVSFDGAYSRLSQPGSGSLKHFWDLNSSPDLKRGSSSSNFSYTYETAGNKYINHAIKDSNGNSDMIFHKVIVLDPDDVPDDNMSPTVRLDQDHFRINGLSVSTSAVLADSDGSILFTEWDWGDRTVDVFHYNEGFTNHQYAAAGTYTVTVRVFDNAGAVTTATHDLTLTAPSSLPLSPLGINGEDHLTSLSEETHWASLSEEEKENLSENFSVALPRERKLERDPAFLLEENKRVSLERDERAKTGCEMKSNGQIRCYSSKDERGGEM